MTQCGSCQPDNHGCAVDPRRGAPVPQRLPSRAGHRLTPRVIHRGAQTGTERSKGASMRIGRMRVLSVGTAVGLALVMATAVPTDRTRIRPILMLAPLLRSVPVCAPRVIHRGAQTGTERSKGASMRIGADACPVGGDSGGAGAGHGH